MSCHQKSRPPVLLDPVSLWRSLTPEQQQAIGVPAIIVGVAYHQQSDDLAWNWEAALTEAEEVMAAAVFETPIAALSLASAGHLCPDLAPIGVRMCHSCGCTDAVGCDGGCHWVGAHLCSSCGGARGNSP